MPMHPDVVKELRAIIKTVLTEQKISPEILARFEALNSKVSASKSKMVAYLKAKRSKTAKEPVYANPGIDHVYELISVFDTKDSLPVVIAMILELKAHTEKHVEQTAKQSDRDTAIAIAKKTLNSELHKVNVFTKRYISMLFDSLSPEEWETIIKQALNKEVKYSDVADQVAKAKTEEVPRICRRVTDYKVGEYVGADVAKLNESRPDGAMKKLFCVGINKILAVELSRKRIFGAVAKEIPEDVLGGIYESIQQRVRDAFFQAPETNVQIILKSICAQDLVAMASELYGKAWSVEDLQGKINAIGPVFINELLSKNVSLEEAVKQYVVSLLKKIVGGNVEASVTPDFLRELINRKQLFDAAFFRSTGNLFADNQDDEKYQYYTDSYEHLQVTMPVLAAANAAQRDERVAHTLEQAVSTLEFLNLGKKILLDTDRKQANMSEAVSSLKPIKNYKGQLKQKSLTLKEMILFDLELMVSETKKINVTEATLTAWKEVAMWFEGLYRHTLNEYLYQYPDCKRDSDGEPIPDKDGYYKTLDMFEDGIFSTATGLQKYGIARFYHLIAKQLLIQIKAYEDTLGLGQAPAYAANAQPGMVLVADPQQRGSASAVAAPLPAQASANLKQLLDDAEEEDKLLICEFLERQKKLRESKDPKQQRELKRNRAAVKIMADPDAQIVEEKVDLDPLKDNYPSDDPLPYASRPAVTESSLHKKLSADSTFDTDASRCIKMLDTIRGHRLPASLTFQMEKFTQDVIAELPAYSGAKLSTYLVPTALIGRAHTSLIDATLNIIKAKEMNPVYLLTILSTLAQKLHARNSVEMVKVVEKLLKTAYGLLSMVEVPKLSKKSSTASLAANSNATFGAADQQRKAREEAEKKIKAATSGNDTGQKFPRAMLGPQK